MTFVIGNTYREFIMADKETTKKARRKQRPGRIERLKQTVQKGNEDIHQLKEVVYKRNEDVHQLNLKTLRFKKLAIKAIAESKVLKR